MGDGGAAEVVRALRDRQETLAAAESLTAGLFAATIADVPGASAVLRGGIVAYATDLKASLVGVDGNLLERRGPVDAEVAAQLALGARERCGADWGIGLTGVAGPDSQDGKPVGLVYVAVCAPDGASVGAELHLTGDRQAIRAQSVTRAMSVLLAAIGDRDVAAGN